MEPKPGPWFKIRTLCGTPLEIGNRVLDLNPNKSNPGIYECASLTIPDPELELLRIENRELRHELQQLLNRARHVLEETTICGTKANQIIERLNFTIPECRKDIEERIPKIEAILRKAQKRDSL